MPEARREPGGQESSWLLVARPLVRSPALSPPVAYPQVLATIAAPAGAAVQQVSVDGVFVPLVGGDWREVKVLAVGTVAADAAGEATATDLSYLARLADHARFGREALAELHRRGTLTAPTVVAVADGAEDAEDEGVSAGVEQAARPTTRKTAGPAISSSRSQRRRTGGASVSPAVMTSSHMAARIVPPWKAPPGWSAPTQKM